MNDETVVIRIKGREQFLEVGKNYFFEFKDPNETSFHLLRSELMNIHWNDKEDAKSFFYIYVHEQKEEYLISDDEIISAKLADLVVGRNYKFIMDNGSSVTGKFLEQKEIGKVVHSTWVEIGRQPVYLNYKDITEILELDNNYW